MATNGSISCAPEFSLFFLGNCISCIYYPVLKDGPNFFNNSLSNTYPEKSFMCSSSTENTEVTKGQMFLNGNVIRVVTLNRPPFVKFINNEFVGAVFELVYALSRKYNFTTKTFLSYDGKWGAENNGVWNGMIGQVLRNEADLGAGTFSRTFERAKVIDFSVAFHQETTGILIPAPQSGNKLTVLIRPLAAEVWLAVLTTIFVLVPSLFVMHIVSLKIRSKVENITAEKPINMLRLIVDLIQFIIGSFVQEGMLSPVNKTTKFLIGIWWLVTLVIANIYVGYMVSFLSAPKLFDLVNNLEGLLSQHKLRWTYRKDTVLEDLFQSSTNRVYKAIGLGAQTSELSGSDMAGVEKVLSGHYAFLKEESFLEVALDKDFNESHKCRVTMAQETFFTVGLALVVQKGCVFLKLLDKEILNAVTSGLMEKWKIMHWPIHLWCMNAAQYIVSTQAKTRKLNLVDCQGASFLLGCGLSLAIIAFVIEKCYRSCTWKRNNSKEHELSKDKDNYENDDILQRYKIIIIPVKEGTYLHNNQSFDLPNTKGRKAPYKFIQKLL